MVKKTQIAFRIDEDVKAALGKAAVADTRNLSSLAEKIIVGWLRENEWLDQCRSKKLGRTAPHNGSDLSRKP